MLVKNKKGSVFLQGWFVFLLFMSVGIQFSLSFYWQNQVSISYDEARNAINEHIKVIQLLRHQAQTCTSDFECETQTITSALFRYFVRFDMTNYNVVEIIISKL